MKVIVFDLDNTLCKLAKPVTFQNLKLLKELEKAGNRIVICSGKPTFYLCGFARQLGLKAPILVGENGAVIQFGVDLPPRDYFIVSNKKETIIKLKNLQKIIKLAFDGKVWFQPNEVCLTIFPQKREYFKDIRNYLMTQELEDCIIYRHIDSFDILPSDVNKYNGLEKLSELLNINRSNFIGIGDSDNDYPMFDFCNLSIGIKIKDKSQVDLNFDNIKEALQYLVKLNNLNR